MTKPAPGVTTITLPMPWELETVNVHLVELDEGVMLIDSGIATDECFDALEESLGDCGLKWSDVRALCLTHLHPDHIGLSWRILDLTGARLIMHRAEAEYDYTGALRETACAAHRRQRHRRGALPPGRGHGATGGTWVCEPGGAGGKG